MKKLVGLGRLKYVAWLALGLLGFASRADAFICYDNNSCLCENPTVVAVAYGWHCCTNWNGCPSNCGTLLYWEDKAARCTPLSGTCTIRSYNQTWTPYGTCSCGSGCVTVGDPTDPPPIGGN